MKLSEGALGHSYKSFPAEKELDWMTPTSTQFLHCQQDKIQSRCQTN